MRATCSVPCPGPCSACVVGGARSMRLAWMVCLRTGAVRHAVAYVLTWRLVPYVQLAAIVRGLGGQLPGQLGGLQVGAKSAELSHAQALLQSRTAPQNQSQPHHAESHTLAQLQALQVSAARRLHPPDVYLYIYTHTHTPLARTVSTLVPLRGAHMCAHTTHMFCVRAY